MRRILGILIVVCLFALANSATVRASEGSNIPNGGVELASPLDFSLRLATPTPPAGPPTSGPGGTDYAYGGYTVTSHGSGATAYYVYEPANPQPASAPLLVLVHGYGNTNPSLHLAWINHLARKGNIVVFPVYQSGSTSPSQFTPNSITAVKAAITWLQANPSHVQPQLDKFAIAGHSYGGAVTVNMANEWQSQGLPQPRAIMPAMAYNGSIDSSLAGIPSTTLMNCLTGNQDTTAGYRGCNAIWTKTSQIPNTNRDYVTFFTDSHGSPILKAHHGVPVQDEINAFDWYGVYKIFDALYSCAFYGTFCDYALGNTANHSYLGTWSDGVPVTPLRIDHTTH